MGQEEGDETGDGGAQAWGSLEAPIQLGQERRDRVSCRMRGGEGSQPRVLPWRTEAWDPWVGWWGL